MKTSACMRVQFLDEGVHFFKRGDLRLEVAVLTRGVGTLEVEEEEVVLLPVSA